MSNPFAAIVSLYALATERLRKEEDGATAVEYGLMVGLIAVAIIAVVGFLGDDLAALFQTVRDELP
ncbi:Flp family type IVb pilin [Trujillonella endophytica]|uniref:Pilus assembly protein Flp/PilA n=1 Tax=Trujillonella endophytica TaxID=673521 RepID=A0A1H8VQU8_9ACTN|nr:Flp family type IVb pilin [Trujillella endophytica]SEP17799.1 pilus assembly protein Flp/PilA [Trujillella endophytica]